MRKIEYGISRSPQKKPGGRIVLHFLRSDLFIPLSKAIVNRHRSQKAINRS
jgi:hypothetical protein